jgi:hypothetical protein
MPASKVPEMKILCSHSTQSALAVGMTIDFVGDNAGKRGVCQFDLFLQAIHGDRMSRLYMLILF